MARRRGSKKHKGIKDPYKQNWIKYEKIKHKINNPPKDANVQEEPKKFQSLRTTEDPFRHTKPRPRRKRNEKELINTARFVDRNVGIYPHNGKPFKQIPTVQQNPGESVFTFLRRVNQVTQMVIKESQFEDKHKVDVKRNKAGQVIKLQPRLTKEIEERRNRKRLKGKEWSLKKKLKKKGIKINLKLGSDLNKSDEGEDDIDQREKELFRKERISFDDIVHEPPKLHTQKLQEKIKEQKKIKAKNFLFLQNMEESDKLPGEKVQSSKARQKILEIERERVILAYRQLQAEKRKSASYR